jgi:ribonuclease-3 family protein
MTTTTDMDKGGSLLIYPPSREPALLNPLVLAYIGDAVFEVFVRQYVISQTNHRPHHLHRQSTRFVSAKAQARALQRILPELTDEERDIVKRGRNAKSGSSPKNTDILDYRHSTAFECLVGYLYYKQDYARLRRLAELVIGPEPETRSEAARREDS